MTYLISISIIHLIQSPCVIFLLGCSEMQLFDIICIIMDPKKTGLSTRLVTHSPTEPSLLPRLFFRPPGTHKKKSPVLPTWGLKGFNIHRLGDHLSRISWKKNKRLYFRQLWNVFFINHVKVDKAYIERQIFWGDGNPVLCERILKHFCQQWGWMMSDDVESLKFRWKCLSLHPSSIKKTH